MDIEKFIEAVAGKVWEQFEPDHQAQKEHHVKVLTHLESIDRKLAQLVASQQEITDALAGDEAALTALAARVADLTNGFNQQNAGLQAQLTAADQHVIDLEAQIDAGGEIDTTALKAALVAIKTHADAIAAIAAAPAPTGSGNTPLGASGSAATPPAPPVQTGGPQPVGGKPLYTLDPSGSPDVAWTATDLRTPSGQMLYTFGPDAPGGPAQGDGAPGLMGGAPIWHLYVGDVIQVRAG